MKTAVRPPNFLSNRPKPVKLRLSDAQFAYLLIIPLIVVLVLINIYPIIHSFWMSLNWVDLAMGTWKFIGVENYVTALTKPDVLHALWVTIVYTLEVTVITTVISVGGALLLNEEFRGKPLLLTIVILPWALSTYATAVIWRYLYSQDAGLFNGVLTALGLIKEYLPFVNEKSAVTAVAVAHSWQLAPLGLFFILASLQVIPLDLYKSAKIDRLGPLGRFRHVTFPYIRNAILITTILVSVEAARAYDVLYFLTAGGPGNASTTLTWYIYVTTFNAFNFGYGSAISYILLVLIMIITTLYFLALFGRGRKAAV